MIISQRAARILRELDVLFVDDNRAMIMIGQKVLKSLKVGAFRSAKDGTGALEALQERPANLIVTDLNMKPMNGLTLTKKIRRGVEGIDPRTPVIALTGNADPNTVKAALQAGVNGFMVKPIEPDTMVRRIEKVITTKVIYQLKGDHYVGNTKTDKTVTREQDLVYDGLLPRVVAARAKTVENPPNKGDEDDMWVLD